MHPNCARLYVEALGNPKAFVALPPSVVDEYFKRIKRFPDGPSPLDLPSVDLLVVGIMARATTSPDTRPRLRTGLQARNGHAPVTILPSMGRRPDFERIPRDLYPMATVAVPPLLPIPGPCGRALQSHNPTNRISGKFKEEIMNGKYDMTDAVNFIRDRCCTGDVEANLRCFHEHYPSMTVQQHNRVIDEVANNLIEEAACVIARAQDLKAYVELMQDLPVGTLVGDAVRVRAAEGNPLAQSLKESFDFDPYSKLYLLHQAAAAAHPEWVVLRQGVYRRAEPNGPTGKDERDGTLIDWFERTHPRQAAAIKRRCGQPFL